MSFVNKFFFELVVQSFQQVYEQLVNKFGATKLSTQLHL